MLLILTHENSDFDAVASLWAAHRLHPEGVPLLARRLNRNVNQFLTLYWGVFRYRRQDDWRRQKIDEVLLVDTHALPSVRGLRPQTPVRVIDHHEKEMVRPEWRVHVDPVGATTTILAEMMQQAGLKISSEEATLFLLGVYEDTGNLTYDTTTSRDVRVAAWLLENGADLSAVRRFMEVPLTAEQQQLYERLLTAAKWHHIGGHAIVVAAARGADDFDDEISSVVGRLRDALLPPAMFVLVALPHRVHLIARSNEESVDASAIARAFGGGGHSRAAAATIHETTLQPVLERLLDLLEEKVQPVVRVSELMSHHVKTVQTSDRIADAAGEMQRHGHEGFPVVDEGGRLAGLLTRRAVDRAITHELGHLPISQIMKPGRYTVRPSDSIVHLQEIMIEEGWGQVPVVAENDPERLIGIVTRTDVLQQLMRPDKRGRKPNLVEQLQQAFDPNLWRLIEAIGREAATLHLPIYFVGGLVRDVLLGKRAVDIDIVAEGEAIGLVDWLVRRFGGKQHTHQRFGTAKWMLSPEVWKKIRGGAAAGEEDGVSLNHLEQTTAIDFVSARTEFYEEPTVLPTVVRGSIKLDLLRRDFTINTLAIRLDGAHLGELLDFYGGLRDLEQGLIRALHSLSFIDDPTRILRAVRFEQRLGFTIEARTLELLENSIELLPRVTGARLWNELAQGFAESDPAAVMRRLAELGVLTQLDPRLCWSEAAAAAFIRMGAVLADPAWSAALPRIGEAGVYLLLWLADHPHPVQEAVVKRLRLSKEMATVLEKLHELLHALAALPAGAPASQVEKLCRPFADFPAALLAARVWLDGQPAAGQLDRYQHRWRHERTEISGHDLRAFGLEPGPWYGEILDQILAARLDGKIATTAEERALLADLAREEAARLAAETARETPTTRQPDRGKNGE